MPKKGRKKLKRFRRVMAAMDAEMDEAQAVVERNLAAVERNLAEMDRLDKEMEDDPEWEAFREELEVRSV